MDALVNESIMVYSAFTRIIGLIIGKVTFQKVSHAVAPSIVHASYIEGEMDCNAARNIRICTPERLSFINDVTYMTISVPTFILENRFSISTALMISSDALVPDPVSIPSELPM